MRLQCDGFSEQGMRRGINQDAIGIFQKEERGLFLVSDGMGGHAEGERASRELKEACAGWWERRQEELGRMDFYETVDQLKELLALTSRRIWEETEPDSICGATVVLLLICGRRYALFWSGDSRCYMLEQSFWKAAVRQLTADDTWENQPGMVKGLSQQEILRHPNFGKLIRAAGVGADFACHVQTGRIEKATLFALCSDGVYKYIESGELEAAMKAALKQGTLQGSLKKLRDAVYENRAPDNLSCILVRGKW